jgi:hypothetical protein
VWQVSIERTTEKQDVKISQEKIEKQKISNEKRDEKQKTKRNQKMKILESFFFSMKSERKGKKK